MASVLFPFLLPIFVCVVLPVSIVLILSITKMNIENRRTEVIIKAIEANKDVETDKLIESLKKPKKTAHEILNVRLLRGCMYSLIGVTFACLGVVKMLSGCTFSSNTVTVPFFLGGISLAIGVSYLIIWKVNRKQVYNTEE